MNSYNVFKDYKGYFGPEINDGDINENEIIFYENKVLTDMFSINFPSQKSFSLLKQFYDEIVQNLTAEEFVRIEEVLENDLGLRIYGIVPFDYENRKRVYLQLFLEIFDMIDKTNFYTITLDKQIELIKNLYNRYGFVNVLDDKDIAETIINNILNWYIED